MNKEILEEFLRAGHIFAGELYPSNGIGISEGSSLSAMLANLILNACKNLFINQSEVFKRKISKTGE